jgi:periplasmic protein TonB
MERHFILPATFAAALHVGLLFGWPSHPVTSTAPKPPGSAPDPGQVIYIADLPPPPSADDSTSGGGSSVPVPSIVDVPRPEGSSKFEMPVIVAPNERIAVGPVTQIPDVRFGPGEGSGPATLPRAIRADLLDRRPNARVQVAPNYPASARAEGRTGEVMVEFIVDESGRVQEPHVMRSSDPVFDAAAVTAVGKWRFEPGTLNSRVVRFRMIVPIVFHLDGE